MGQQNLSFNNFEYDDGDTNEDTMDLSAEMQMNSTMNTTQENALNDGNESELTALEEDGGLTVTSLGILGIIIFSLTAYVLYWFCCSNTSKGYRQHSQYMNNDGYYDDDIDTEDYATRYREKQVYDDRINGNEDKEDSDWSEDEQLGVVDDYS